MTLFDDDRSGCPVDGCERGALHVGGCGPAFVPTPLATTPRARRTDPETSHAAALTVGELRPRQAAVLDLLDYLGPCIDEQLCAEYQRRAAFVGYLPQTDSGVRTRRSELVAAGFVEATGDKRAMSTGRLARVWRAVPHDIDQTTTTTETNT